MTSQLIPVFNGTIANEKQPYLQCPRSACFFRREKVFAAWDYKSHFRIQIIENQDYICFLQFGKAKHLVEAVTTATTLTPRYSQRTGYGGAQRKRLPELILHLCEKETSQHATSAAPQTRKSSSSATHAGTDGECARTSANSCTR